MFCYSCPEEVMREELPYYEGNLITDDAGMQNVVLREGRQELQPCLKRQNKRVGEI